MMSVPNYRLIATDFGELIKYSSVLKEINRAGIAIFRFPKETFPNEHITSQRAKAIYDWIMSLGKQNLTPDERSRLLITFCKKLVREEQIQPLIKILEDAGIHTHSIKNQDLECPIRKTA